MESEKHSGKREPSHTPKDSPPWRQTAGCRRVDSARTGTPLRTACAADMRFSTAKPKRWLDLGLWRLSGSHGRSDYRVLETARSSIAKDGLNGSRAYAPTITSAGVRRAQHRTRKWSGGC